MSIKTSKALTDASDSLLSLPIISFAVSHAYAQALVIVCIIVLIALFIFGDNDSKYSRVLRLGFWSYLIITGILLLRDRNEQKQIEDAERSGLINEIFRPANITESEHYVTTRAQNPVGYSANPLLTREQVAHMVEERAAVRAREMVATGAVPPASVPATPGAPM